MQGEFDDQLKWPFHGDIIIKLMNQEEDKDHVVKTASFTSSTPIKGKRFSTGHGYSQFLPLTELQPKYMKNDCIKFCIK